jgi:hypothetical protein
MATAIAADEELFEDEVAVEVEEGPKGPAPLRSIVDIISDLKQPIPASYLEKREAYKNGPKLTYWPWYVGVRALDHYAPGWSSEIRQVIHTDGHIGVVMRVYIPCLENPSPGIFREDMGGDYEHLDVQKREKGFDPFLDAKQQAFKRCCTQFGFGLYLYEG